MELLRRDLEGSLSGLGGLETKLQRSAWCISEHFQALRTSFLHSSPLDGNGTAPEVRRASVCRDVVIPLGVFF